MLTPNEIAEKKFDKVMVWGYDMNAVDSFLESVSADYTQLYKENIALKNKMKVLVSKIEEYRSVDESMRQTLLNAKNLAAEMSANAEAAAEKVRTDAEVMAEKLRADAQTEAEKCRAEAQAEADKLLRDARAEAAGVREEALTIAAKYRTEAETEAETSLASYKERIAAQEMRLEEAKTNVQVFIDKSIELYRKELDALTTMREQELSYEIVVPATPVEETPAVTPVVTASAPAAAPVIDVPAAPAAVEAPVTVEAPAAPAIPEMPAAREVPPEELILPDTVPLPNLPPIPTAKPAAAPAAPQPKPAATKRVYEVDTDDEDEDEFVKPAKRRIDEVAAAKRAAAQRSVREEDNEETIVLTPKPRFEFSNLQFGDKYSSSDKKRK